MGHGPCEDHRAFTHTAGGWKIVQSPDTSPSGSTAHLIGVARVAENSRTTLEKLRIALPRWSRVGR